MERILLRRLGAKSTILDLCCGTGNFARALTYRGFSVIGLDGSEEMIRFASNNAPDGRFFVSDARNFKLRRACDAAVCLFDSLNHIMSLEELSSAFRRVHEALKTGGEFVFDLNMEEGYRARWRGSKNIIEDDCVCLVRFGYREQEKIAASHLTLFRLEKQWQRFDLSLLQKCYSEEEIRSGLEAAGFENMVMHEGQRDLRLSAKGAGRAFFICRKAQ